MQDYTDFVELDGEKKTKADLTKVNLRANQLKGCIILGNYGVSIIRMNVTRIPNANTLCLFTEFDALGC